MANTDTLNTFLTIFNDTHLSVDQTIQGLMPLFCDDIPDTKGHLIFPGVGITDHGPGFKGRADVEIFLRKLFGAFLDMQWTYPPPSNPGAPIMQSPDLNTIGFQIDVTGRFQAPWFRSGTHVSKPLSQLNAGTNRHLGKHRNDASGVPGSAVFTFFAGDAQFRIKQIAIYMDRYAMMQSITAHHGDWDPDT